MNNLVTRTITGVFFVAAIIGTMILHPLAFGAVFFLVLLVGTHELFVMVEKQGFPLMTVPAYLFSSVIYILAVLVANHLLPFYSLAFIPVLLILFFIVELFSKKDNPVASIAFSLLPAIYLAIPLATLSFLFDPALHGTNFRFFIPLGFFLILWAHDIFAYLTGLAIGRHKLFERISPKKTWEGSMGGVIFALLMAWALSLFMSDLDMFQWLGMALIIAIFGTLGDLAESMIKRNFGVKDSGSILPGHGGVLDRFDATLFAAPAVLVYLFILFS